MNQEIMKETKISRLFQEIDNLERELVRARQLRARIFDGDNEEKNSKAAPEIPQRATLAALLNDGPGRINDLAAGFAQVTEELNGLIY
jgi:hypothetical protein